MPGSEDYAYIHEDDQPAEPKGLGTTEATPGELNPAYYFESVGGALKEDADYELPEGDHGAPSEIVNAQRGESDIFGPSTGVLQQAEPAVVDKQETPADATRPDGNDSTAKWREWAISKQGMPAEEARTLSRRELMERYPADS